jgi:hypothetical protein
MRERELLKSARNYVEAVATSGKVGSVFAKNLLVEIDEYLQKPLPESKPQEFDLLQEDPVERQQFDEIVSRLNINPLVAVKDALATMHKCAEYPQGSYAKMLAIYSNEIAKAVFASKDPSSARIAIYTEPTADSLADSLAESYSDALRSLAHYVGCGGYNTDDPIDAKVFEDKIRYGIDLLLQAQSHQCGRKPLSDDEIQQGIYDLDKDVFTTASVFLAGVIFAEEKHGIKERE